MSKHTAAVTALLATYADRARAVEAQKLATALANASLYLAARDAVAERLADEEAEYNLGSATARDEWERSR